MTFAPVREARRRGQRYLAEIVAVIPGRYSRADDPAHGAARVPFEYSYYEGAST